MKAARALMFLCLLFPAVALHAGQGHFLNEAGFVKVETKGEGIHPASFLSDGRRRGELLGYAKALFLARLGFGAPVEPPGFLKEFQHACFVTFFSGKRVIACFGGFYPRTGNVAAEIEENIRMALFNDPRARSIDRATALASHVQITFPGEPRAVRSYAEINPLREGLLVENDRRGVAIVPGEAKTASWAFREAMRRLGEKDPARVRIFRFHAFAVSGRTLKK